MGKGSGGERSLGAAAAAVAAVLLLAGCSSRIGGPAPLVSGDASPAEVPPGEVKVQRGQTLSGIAQAYHVPMHVLAEANHLSPPYRIAVGRTLTIPAAGAPAGAEAPVSLAALPPPQPEAAAAARPAEPVPPDRASPAPVEKPSIAAAPLPAPAKPAAPRSLEPGAPDAASDNAAPSPAAAEKQTPSAATLRPAPVPPSVPSSASAGAPPPAERSGGTFLWPVRGRVLESYGAGADGTHNDGINIAAPRGAAVQAADAGVVAYAGNELRGYGNLILVKHANGWISAYAHCDLILVKKGEKVGRGQVIARVGSSGNVAEPQLHFELRRGNKAVDPRGLLAPLPSAGSPSAASPTAAAKDPRPG